MTDPKITASWIAYWVLTGVGTLFVVVAVGGAFGLDIVVILAAALGAGLLVGARAAQTRAVADAAPPGSWWKDPLSSVRTGVASIVALVALAMIWWGWNRFGDLDPPQAKQIMDSMLALITAVLGYLFGRGEAANAEKVADHAKGLAGDATTEAKKLEPNAKAFKILAEWAKEDAFLSKYVTEAQRNVQGQPAPGEEENDAGPT